MIQDGWPKHSNPNVGEGIDLMATIKEQLDNFLKSDVFKSIIKASFAEALKGIHLVLKECLMKPLLRW